MSDFYNSEEWLKLVNRLKQQKITFNQVQRVLIPDPINAPLGVWISKDGTEILIKDMDSNHIRNAIKMLGRKYLVYSKSSIINEKTRRKIEELQNELSSRDQDEDFALVGAL